MKLHKYRSFRLNDELIAAVEKAAETETFKREVEVTVSVIIRTALVEYLKRHGHLSREAAND